jgi:L-cysteine desulfidase
LCDGAKLSCAWKIEAALVAGFRAMELIENKRSLSPNEGINNRDAFETIKSLGELSKRVMNITNVEVIDIINRNSQ